MALRDWSELPGNQPGSLDLPIDGVTYRIRQPGARVTGNLIAMEAAARAAIRRAEEAGSDDLDLDADSGLDITVEDLYRDALGDAYEAMLEADVPAPALARAFQAVAAWALHDSVEAAERVWEGKAAAPMSREQRRSTGTPSRSNGSGTTRTRSTTPKKAPAKASGSRGSKSGRSGR